MQNTCIRFGNRLFTYQSATISLSIQRSESDLSAESGHVEEEDDKGEHEMTNNSRILWKRPSSLKTPLQTCAEFAIFLLTG